MPELRDGENRLLHALALAGAARHATLRVRRRHVPLLADDDDVVVRLIPNNQL